MDLFESSCGLLLLHVISVRFTCVAACRCGFSFSSWVVFFSSRRPPLVRPSHRRLALGGFQSGAFVNSFHTRSQACLLGEHLDTLLLGIFLGVELLGHPVGICSAWADVAKQFSKVLCQCIFPPTVYEGSICLLFIIVPPYWFVEISYIWYEPFTEYLYK